MPGPNKGQTLMAKSEDTWQPLDQVTNRLFAKSVEAMNLGQWEIAEAYHERAVDLKIAAWLKEMDK